MNATSDQRKPGPRESGCPGDTSLEATSSGDILWDDDEWKDVPAIDMRHWDPETEKELEEHTAAEKERETNEIKFQVSDWESYQVPPCDANYIPQWKKHPRVYPKTLNLVLVDEIDMERHRSTLDRYRQMSARLKKRRQERLNEFRMRKKIRRKKKIKYSEILKKCYGELPTNASEYNDPHLNKLVYLLLRRGKNKKEIDRVVSIARASTEEELEKIGEED